MKEGECDSFGVRSDLSGKQVFHCTNNCTILLYINFVLLHVIWMVSAAAAQYTQMMS